MVHQAHDDHGAAGIQTFLIADIRGYTRFTQEHGDEAATELAAVIGYAVYLNSGVVDATSERP